MAKNWAIAIGINQYNYLQPLQYAKRDAQLMQEFLQTEAGFDPILFFSDDSPDRAEQPIRANLLRVLRQLSEKPRLGVGDNFWFFFSGHGMRHAGRDYLMPCDGDPEDIENTAISINDIRERLRSCGADNVVLILDACRSQGTRAGEGIGRQTAEEARSTGEISIFSCSPNEYSFEIEALQQGAFTHALLEGLGIQGKCATVERLNHYLTWRVPELVRQHKNARQTPYTIAEPLPKSHLILVPRYATLVDIATLKIDAYQAEVEQDLDLAEQLWIRVLSAASGRDMDAIRAIQRIAQLRVGRSELKTDPIPQPSSLAGKGEKSSPPLAGEGVTGRGGEREILTDGLFGSPRSRVSCPNCYHPNPRGTPQCEACYTPLPNEICPDCGALIPPQNKFCNQCGFNLTLGKQKKQTDNLSSDKGVDYTKLQDLLAQGKWKEADQETLAVMLKVAGREEKGWLTSEDIEKFPCTDLRTIDTLWVKYSKGRFGFSVQKRIWESVGGTPDTDYETYKRFGDRIKWHVNNKWLENYDDFTFTKEAPEGHLPVGKRVYDRVLDGWGGKFLKLVKQEGGVNWMMFSSLASRLVNCSI